MMDYMMVIFGYRFVWQYVQDKMQINDIDYFKNCMLMGKMWRVLWEKLWEKLWIKL